MKKKGPGKSAINLMFFSIFAFTIGVFIGIFLAKVSAQTECLEQNNKIVKYENN